jgi:spermidine/putrescine transport system substrate-binding protein
MRHPRDRGNRLSRREFLRRSAAMGVALPSAAAILAACGRDETTAGAGDAGVGFNLTPDPQNPVTLPIYDDNQPIASGLEPESNTTFKIFNWNDYLWKKKLDEFGEQHGVRVEYTNFYNMEQAVEKLRTGDLDVDLFFPTIDVLGRLVAAKLLQPLNKDYITTFDNLWPNIQTPFYDQKSTYSVPYTIYTTGIAYLRTDVDPETVNAKTYDIFWDPRYKGKVGLYDDYREAIGMALLKNGITDVNTEDPADIEIAKNDLLQMIAATDVRLSINGAYAKLPAAVYSVHQSWSGDIIGAQYYTGNGVTVDDLGFWFPEEGGGVIGNDLIAIPKNARNPVLAHLFLDFILDNKHGLENFSWVGYQPPLTSLEPGNLVDQGYVPPSVENSVVRQEDFDKNQRYLALSPQGDAVWLDAWEEITAGAVQPQEEKN